MEALSPRRPDALEGDRGCVTEIVLGDPKDLDAGSSQASVAPPVVEDVEELGVAQIAIDLDVEAGLPVVGVRPADPPLLASEIDLAVGERITRSGQEGEEASFVAALPGDEAGVALVEQPPHERTPPTTMLEQLDGHPAKCVQPDGAPGQGVVDRPLRPPGVQAPGTVEQRACSRRHRDAVHHDDVVGGQVSGLVQRGDAGSTTAATSLAAHMEPDRLEAGQAEQGKCRLVRGDRMGPCVEDTGHDLLTERRDAPGQPQDPTRAALPRTAVDTVVEHLRCRPEPDGLRRGHECVLLRRQPAHLPIELFPIHGTNIRSGVRHHHRPRRPGTSI